MSILNLGCGTSIIAGATNVDKDESIKADLHFDIKGSFPLEDASYDEIYLFHTIEHVEKQYHARIFSEIRRVMKDTGTLIVTFPEFSKIIENWRINKNNERQFWEMTIFGRQMYPSDYHVCAMDSLDFKQFLQDRGFIVNSILNEPIDTFNTIMSVGKGPTSITYEELIFNEIFAAK